MTLASLDRDFRRSAPGTKDDARDLPSRISTAGTQRSARRGLPNPVCRPRAWGPLAVTLVNWTSEPLRECTIIGGPGTLMIRAEREGWTRDNAVRRAGPHVLSVEFGAVIQLCTFILCRGGALVGACLRSISE